MWSPRSVEAGGFLRLILDRGLGAELENGNLCEIACVDIEGIACGQNDPTILGCRRLYIVALAEGSGPTGVGEVL